MVEKISGESYCMVKILDGQWDPMVKGREGTLAQKAFAQKSVAQKTKFIYIDFSCSEKNFMSN